MPRHAEPLQRLNMNGADKSCADDACAELVEGVMKEEWSGGGMEWWAGMDNDELCGPF
ncbi:MAG: hypothetical protein ACKVY0_06850 [Prosthecobacter sp.]